MTIDLTILLEKYAAEAPKRLRPDGVEQFQEVSKSDSTRLPRLASLDSS